MDTNRSSLVFIGVYSWLNLRSPVAGAQADAVAGIVDAGFAIQRLTGITDPGYKKTKSAGMIFTSRRSHSLTAYLFRDKTDYYGQLSGIGHMGSLHPFTRTVPPPPLVTLKVWSATPALPLT